MFLRHCVQYEPKQAINIARYAIINHKNIIEQLECFRILFLFHRVTKSICNQLLGISKTRIPSKYRKLLCDIQFEIQSYVGRTSIPESCESSMTQMHTKIKNSLAIIINDLINNDQDCFPQSLNNFISNCDEFENFTHHILFFAPNETEVMIKIIIYENLFHGNFILASKYQPLIELLQSLKTILHQHVIQFLQAS
jgi:hypothetical protein